MATDPYDNHIYLTKHAVMIATNAARRYREVMKYRFKDWFGDVLRLVDDYSYSELTSHEYSEDHAKKYKYAIGYAYLNKLNYEARVCENPTGCFGTVGNITFDKTIEGVFVDLGLKDSKEDDAAKKLTGMIYTAENSIPSGFLKTLKQHGANQVGTENFNLPDRAIKGAVSYVAKKCLTFACNDASESYLAQWLAMQKNLCTFTLFTRGWLKNHSFIITIRHFVDLALIGRCFPFKENSLQPEIPNKITVLICIVTGFEELEDKLELLAEELELSSPHFNVCKEHWNKQSNKGWKKENRIEMRSEHHLIIVPAGCVRPPINSTAACITVPICVRSEETKEIVTHNIEIISNSCRYDLFDFSAQVFNLMIVGEPEQPPLSFLESFPLQTGEYSEPNVLPAYCEGNLKILSNIAEEKNIRKLKKYKAIKSKTWFRQVVEDVMNNPYVVAKGLVKRISLYDNSDYDLTIDGHLIAMVCLHIFDLQTKNLNSSRKKPGKVGTLIFDYNMKSVLSKLEEEWQSPLGGMIFVAEDGLPDSIKQYVTDKGATQLATEESFDFTRKYRFKGFLSQRRRSGAAYFVRLKSIHFALNINHGCHSEQFVAKRLGIYTCTVNSNIPDKEFSVTITTADLSSLKLVADCFMLKPDEFYQPKPKHELKILYHLGNESQKIDELLTLSAERVMKIPGWNCTVDIMDNEQNITKPFRTSVQIFKGEEYPEREHMRKEAGIPYPDSDRHQMKSGEYDFIIAPPEWVKPSESFTSISITMPARAYVNKKFVNHHIEVISHDCCNKPFEFAKIFTALMNRIEKNRHELYALV